MNYRKLVFLFGMIALLGSTVVGQNYKYIGAAKCKICHNKVKTGEQYKKWAEGPHAKAMKILSAEEQKNQSCIKCHSTAESVDSKLVASIKVEEGVSCESCHGPGSVYKSAGIMKNKKLAMSKGLVMPDEKVCRRCHNDKSPHFKGFNFEEYKAKIAHGIPVSK